MIINVKILEVRKITIKNFFFYFTFYYNAIYLRIAEFPRSIDCHILHGCVVLNTANNSLRKIWSASLRLRTV